MMVIMIMIMIIMILIIMSLVPPEVTGGPGGDSQELVLEILPLY